MKRTLFGLFASVAVGALLAVAPAQAQTTTGNVVFFHPDGTGLSFWVAARNYFAGPDGNLHWDTSPFRTPYRGHMDDQLVATSNGGATTHAFGYKVAGPGSFGQDGERAIRSLSGFPGSILREATAKGHPVGLVNDGDLPEPGTGAFAAEVASRGDAAEILDQMINGRPGLRPGTRDADIWVLMGGGEGFALPAGTPRCGATITPDCHVHVDPYTGEGPAGLPGRNLIQEAIAKGYVVVRTRAEFEALKAQVLTRPNFTPKVLGLFARDDIFNDRPEEQLVSGNTSLGLPPLINQATVNTREGRLVLWGDLPGTPGFNPPTAAEMHELALIILERVSNRRGKPFLLVTEVEATDNFGNGNNGIGSLVATKRADDVIGVTQTFIANVDPNTLYLYAADSDGSAMQLVDDSGNADASNANPTGSSSQNVNNPRDGIEGRGTPSFLAAPDAAGNQFPFAISWPGTPDTAGGILAKAEGLNAEQLHSTYLTGIDNTDIYRLMYETLFGVNLPSPRGQQAPSR